MRSFSLSVLAADQPFFVGEAISLVLPTPEGLYGVLAHHTNAILAVAPGLLKITLPDNEVRYAAVSEGMIKIENNEVLILVDSAERPEDIDLRRAERAAEQAREEILQKRSILEHRSAEAHLARALNRIKIGSQKR